MGTDLTLVARAAVVSFVAVSRKDAKPAKYAKGPGVLQLSYFERHPHRSE